MKNFFIQIKRIFSYKEKLIMIFLVLIFLSLGSYLIYKNYLKDTIETPTFGGSYIEGMIVQNEQEITQMIDKLTKISLTKFDKNGKIVPNVAESWEVLDDTKTYIFKINEKFNRDEITQILKKQKNKWANIEIENHNEREIVCRFSESFAPFLSLTTTPIIPNGLYKLAKTENSGYYFEANKDYFEGCPFIEKLVIKIYPDWENLIKAYEGNKIDGFYKIDKDLNYPNLNKYTFDLPRYNIAFINTQRDFFKSKDVRKKLKNFEKFDNETNIIIVSLDTDEYKKITQELAKKWEENNIKSTIYYKNSKEIINNIIPKRDYDILIYGLDYESDPDPYPFWHSTQANEFGFNLSNFSNIDADILLEEARKTTDEKLREEKYNKFWEIFNEEVPAIIISQEQWIFGVINKVKRIETGFSISPTDRFFNIKDWYIKTKRIKKSN